MNVNTPYSDLKILYHTQELNEFLKGEHIAPIYIRIKPTNVCNQNCFYCCYADDQAIETRKVNRNEFIPYTKMMEIIEDISDMGVKAVTFSGGGEPLCYPYIEETFHKIIDHNIELSLITNGQLLYGDRINDLKYAKWVRISLDSANENTYKKIRGVSTFNSVINNIEHFAKIKDGSCELGINFVINEINYEQVYDICKLVSNIGVNNIKFSGMMIQKGTQEYHQQIKEKVDELIEKALLENKNTDFKIINKYEENLGFTREYNKCYTQQFVTIIAADQGVYRCHQKAYTTSGRLGSIENCSFKDLWFSKEVTEKIENFSPQCECKATCVYDQRNALLNNIKNLDKNHINFI